LGEKDESYTVFEAKSQGFYSVIRHGSAVIEQIYNMVTETHKVRKATKLITKKQRVNQREN